MESTGSINGRNPGKNGSTVLILFGFVIGFVICFSSTLCDAASVNGTTVSNWQDTVVGDRLKFRWTTKMRNETIERSIHSMVEFYCGIEPTPDNRDWYRHERSILWLKDNHPVNFNNQIRITKPGWSLKIVGLKAIDSGNYTCLVTYEKHQLQWTFFLKVLYAPASYPIIEERPSNMSAVVGSSVSFTCKCLPMPHVEMFWAKLHYINGSYGSGPLVHGDAHATILMNWSFTHTPLLIENVKLEDEGWFMCGFKNNLGDVYEAAYLTVMEDYVLRTPVTERESAINYTNIIITCLCLFIILVIVCVISIMVFCYKKRRLQMTQYRLYHTNEVSVSEPLVKHRRWSSRFSSRSYPSMGIGSSRISDNSYEFPKNRLTIYETIGEGAFGVVHRAMAYGIDKEHPISCVVAVKTLKDGATHQEKFEFVKEVEVMKSVKKFGNHINIVNFLGCCTQNGPLYVIVEYCQKGNLRDYLLYFRTQSECNDDTEIYVQEMENESTHSKQILSQKVLLSFSHQIACGMEFLSSNKTIHRDLAARNVLVTDNNILKIADFGLARNGDYYKKTSKGQIPVKWMPTEALMDLNYTEKSDVWSFGIVLWEIFTLGEMPYPTIPHEDMYNKLMEGYRLPKPPLSSCSLYDTMKQCWHLLPEDRPNFKTLVLTLETQLVQVSNSDYLEVLPDVPALRPGLETV